MMPQPVALPPVAAGDAGGGNGPGKQWDGPHLLLPWHGNRPLFVSRGKSQDGQVASRVDQGGADPVLSQLLKGSIDGHAFGDTSEVQLDAGGQRHTAVDGIDFDTTPAASWLTRDDRVETGGLGGREVIEGAIIAHLYQLIQ